MRFSAALLGACLAGVPLMALAASSITPGRWRSEGIVTSVDMPGLPPEALAMMKRRPISHSYCVTPDEAEAGARGLFSEGNGACEYSRFSMNGGRINAVMKCKGPQGNTQLTMLGTFGATSYETTNVMVMGGPQGPMRMTTRMTGKRVGDC
jgi:Protein of unknown function (DUF3617)